MDDMDWRAACSSEIFRNYALAELANKKANEKTAEQIEKETSNITNAFEEFQMKVNSSNKLKATFKELQNLFLTNEKYASTIDQRFVESVLLLKID